MPGMFSVTPEELLGGAGRLKSTADAIGGQLTAAKGEVRKLAAGWTGEASAQFEQLMQEWDKLAQQQHQNLISISTTLEKAGQAYGETETSVRGAFRV